LFAGYFFTRIVDQWRVLERTMGVLCVVRVGAVPSRCLPGNPVASFVTFAHVARPMILALAGAVQQKLIPMPVRAAFG
jgi:molybdopterin molybdotransferase